MAKLRGAATQIPLLGRPRPLHRWSLSFRPAVLCLFATLCVLVPIAGCGSEDTMSGMDAGAGTDVGEGMDVTIADAPPMDSGAMDVAPDQPAVDSAVRMCSGGSCDPIAQEGCPGEGASCYLSRGTAHCETESGTQLAGSSCDAVNVCTPGMSCFATDGATVGACAQPCCALASGDCPRGQRCVGGRELFDGSSTPWAHCAPSESCEILMDDACARGQGCYIVSSEGETECRPRGEGGNGEACTDVTDCDPGYFCAGLSERTCRRLCRVGESDCGRGEGRCQAYSYSPDGTGVCTVESTTNRAP